MFSSVMIDRGIWNLPSFDAGCHYIRSMSVCLVAHRYTYVSVTRNKRISASFGYGHATHIVTAYSIFHIRSTITGSV